MSELVLNQNGKPVTNSLLVSKKFVKQHKDVLRTVRNIVEDMTAQNCAVPQMFIESTYCNEQGKEQPIYIMDRDGFSLLVMGFTGKQALKFKLDFIKAFNQMEAELKADRRQLIPSDDICLAHLRTINSFGYKLIKQLEAPLTREQRMHVFTRFINIAGFEFAGMQAELDQYYQDPAALDYYLNNQYNPFTEGRAAL